jgi:hypothetical protein
MGSSVVNRQAEGGSRQHEAEVIAMVKRVAWWASIINAEITHSVA